MVKTLVPKFLVYKEETFTKRKIFFHYIHPRKFHTMEILVIKKFEPLFFLFFFFFFFFKLINLF
jgi:hypothetical protein